MTTISRVFGLIRDVVIATFFGPGVGVDAFIVAFRIPNFLRRLFAEGGFSQAFVPILSEYKEQRSHDEVKALLDQTTATLEPDIVRRDNSWRARGAGVWCMYSPPALPMSPPSSC